MFLRKDNCGLATRAYQLLLLLLSGCLSLTPYPYALEGYEELTEEDFGLLVQVGFDITAFRPPAYQRGSLPRPSKEVSS